MTGECNTITGICSAMMLGMGVGEYTLIREDNTIMGAHNMTGECNTIPGIRNARMFGGGGGGMNTL